MNFYSHTLFVLVCIYASKAVTAVHHYRNTHVQKSLMFETYSFDLKQLIKEGIYLKTELLKFRNSRHFQFQIIS